jgi:FkbM family methyltransferase
MNSLQDWLLDKIETDIIPQGILLDVGAYHGDFTKSLLVSNKIQFSLLFEPNIENLAHLRRVFVNDSRVNIVSAAVSDSMSEVDFYYTSDLATGSVLQYEDSNQNYTATEIKKTTVKQITLDHYFSNNFVDTPISIVKIDTQGADLKVLMGAKSVLKKYHPLLVIELIFIDLYKQQAQPHDFLNWLSNQGYSLGGMFNNYYTEDGWLAFADGVFIPKHWNSTFNPPFHGIKDTNELQKEIKMLRKVCDERLDLINSLHSEAEKRLKIINNLKNKKS